jgi:hypothetical protein
VATLLPPVSCRVSLMSCQSLYFLRGVGHLSVGQSLVGHLPLHWDKRSSFFRSWGKIRKSFITLRPGSDVIQLFTLVSNTFL